MFYKTYVEYSICHDQVTCFSLNLKISNGLESDVEDGTKIVKELPL